MSTRTLTIGTRGSKLALRQAHWVAERLRQTGSGVAIRVIKTTGDLVTRIPLDSLGPQQGIKGVFTKEIEDALLAGAIDLAVHSLKDLPAELDPRLALGCVPQRADPRDALLGAKLGGLRRGDRVGTGSPRRAAQLRQLLPAVEVIDMRGNVDTRIRKLREGVCQAIVLAVAGLERLGLEGEIAQILDTAQMVPAIGQGALGIEVRSGDGAVLEAIAPLHDEVAAAEVEAERALLRAFGGGCAAPLGANASEADGQLTLRAAVARDGDAQMARAEDSAPVSQAAVLGARVAASLRGRGVDGSAEPAG